MLVNQLIKEIKQYVNQSIFIAPGSKVVERLNTFSIIQDVQNICIPMVTTLLLDEIKTSRESVLM